MKSTLLQARPRPGGFSLIEVVVALALLTIGVVSVIQLFSGSLRTVKKSEDYSKALIYASSLIDEALSLPGVQGIEGVFELEEEFKARRAVRVQSSDGDISLYEITVTVTWPPSGSLELSGLRTIREDKR